MGVILLDADVLIAFERRSFDLQTWIDSRATDEFALAAITVAELRHAIERDSGSRRSSREAFLTRLLGSFEILDYTADTAQEHARIWAALEVAGNRINGYDMIVAATALEWNAAVATFNAKHFRMVDGLDVIVPDHS